jgi:rhodanese-related sulfurtransferase
MRRSHQKWTRNANDGGKFGGDFTMTETYAGDLTPAQAWELLGQDGQAVLVDVRTQPEWQFVGLPDASAHGRDAALIAWQVYPEMQINPEFMNALADAAPDPAAPVLFLCRSGVRSRAAASAATAAGYARAYNISEGFEGDPNADQQRGKVGGWKAAGLPWRQG